MQANKIFKIAPLTDITKNPINTEDANPQSHTSCAYSPTSKPIRIGAINIITKVINTNNPYMICSLCYAIFKV